MRETCSLISRLRRSSKEPKTATDRAEMLLVWTIRHHFKRARIGRMKQWSIIRSSMMTSNKKIHRIARMTNPRVWSRWNQIRRKRERSLLVPWSLSIMKVLRISRSIMIIMRRFAKSGTNWRAGPTTNLWKKSLKSWRPMAYLVRSIITL